MLISMWYYLILKDILLQNSCLLIVAFVVYLFKRNFTIYRDFKKYQHAKEAWS